MWEAHCHRLGFHLRSMQDTFDHEELEVSALATEYSFRTSERHRNPSDSYYERSTVKQEIPLVLASGSFFEGGNMTKAMITALLLNSFDLAVRIYNTIIKFMWVRAPLVLAFDVCKI